MYFEGVAKLDKKTKNLVKRLRIGDIAVIDHPDLDRVSAEALVESKVEVVLNVAQSISGRYPNLGPLILCSAGVYLVDNVGADIFKKIKEGDRITVQGEEIFRDGECVGKGEILTTLSIRSKMEKAEENLSDELESFAINTLSYIQKEKDWIIKGMELPDISTNFAGRHALIVIRGYDYREDLRMLRSYIREYKPVLIGVDGGADALIEAGYRPDMIIGDMDSVSDKALLSGAETVVHAYVDGRAPGLERLKKLGLSPKTFKAPGTSEDLALLLAYEKRAELIVAVGSHAHLIEFLDKGRAGMASTFLVRLKVGSKLIDAKGVNKLYRSTAKMSELMVILASALVVVVALVLASPMVKSALRLVVLALRTRLGI